MSPRTKAQNKEIREQSRQQIIDAAFELFAETGYQKTSIAAISKKAGISKGLIYHYFESKEDVLIGIFEMLTAMGDQIIDAGQEKSPKEHLKEVITQTFTFIEHQYGLGKLMISLALQPDALEPLKAQIREGNHHQIERFAEIFEELGYQEPTAEAYTLGAMLDGAMLGFITMGNDYPLEQIKQLILKKYELN
ncbi:MAG: TetR/AcrR family transcriptional regulator [Balneolaceae bacterium]|nr:TetR/AcrR family transcriptional regulator [Balneolaceae bacterium]